MASLIKNQILKHLSRFVKNLSSDKINLSTLKGEGELKNLQLEEEVLTELLALPTWMKLTHAHCDKASIRIPWTKLRSVPILLSLDTVTITVEACEQLRSCDAAQTVNAFASSGKYGFVQKVIDGITVLVNSVEIRFCSKAFEANFQINRIRVESRSPKWTQAELQHTRLKCVQRGETLIFKAMDWQAMRLEARSTSDRSLAPLRLLTNQAKAHIVIKKRLSDCQVLGSRLSLILDELLWVLTDSQILAALHFVNSISGLIKQATEMTQKVKAVRKLESLPEYQAQLSQTSALQHDQVSAAAFDQFDVKETSYHFICQKIDLHFCDDPGSGRSNHEDLKDGGALQLSLKQVNIDFYPYHLAQGDRKFWQKYSSDNNLSRWLTQSLNSFRIALIDAISCNSLHSPLSRTHNNSATADTDGSLVKKKVLEMFAKLMSTCLVLKVQDLVLYKVTTSSKRTAPEPFICSYMDRPKDLPTIHVEFTWCYYPGDVTFPVPSAKLYAHLFPIQVNIDTCTILWLNSFAANLENSSITSNESPEQDYMDVRVELMMPKAVFENKLPSNHRERPIAVQFQISKMVFSNYRSPDTGSLSQLAQCLDLLQRGDLAYGFSFPAQESDMPLVADKFVKHAEGGDKLKNLVKTSCSSFQDIAPLLTKDMMNTEPRDLWYLYIDQLWADFLVSSPLKKQVQETRFFPGQRSTPAQKLFPFIDALPIAFWIYMSEDQEHLSSEVETQKTVPRKKKSIQAIFSASKKCNVQMTHYQYLFVMRMAEAFSELSVYLTYDLEKIVGEKIYDNLLTVIGYLPRIEINFVFPPSLDEKHDSAPDLDSSGIPESSSGENEINQSGEGDMWKLSEDRLPKLPVIQKPDSLDVPPSSMSCGNSPTHASSLGAESFRSSFSHVKHGMSNLVVSFNKTAGGISTPDSEVASLSNFSSGSSENNFIQIDTLGGDSLVDNGIEVACEVMEDNRSTPSPSFFMENVDRIAYHEEVVKVLMVALDHVELAQESRGLTAVQKFQCRSIFVEERPEMTYKDFQALFVSKCRWGTDDGVANNLGSPSQPRVIKVRLSQKIDVQGLQSILESKNVKTIIQNIKTPNQPRINLCDRPGAESPLRQAVIDSTIITLNATIDLREQEAIKLHMTTLMSLTDLVEDEIVPTPFPIQANIIGANLELTEDRPPANDTSPGVPPLKIVIPEELKVYRDKDGIVHVGSSGSGNNSTSCEGGSRNCSSTCKNAENLRAEIDVLLTDFQKVQKQLELARSRNTELEDQLKGTESLKMMVLDLQEQVKKLQDEKLSLLKSNFR